MSERKECILNDVAALKKKAIISGPFGSNISSKYFTEVGIPVIRGNNLSLDIGKKFIDDGFVFISEEKANELGTWAEKDDLIFTAAGTIGQVGILQGKEKYKRYIISNKQLRVTLNKSIIEPLYAYYWFASPINVDLIMKSDTGSTIPLINLSVLKSLPISLPSLPEQGAIVSVLSCLDDKIALLHCQNKTLEAMADAFFRHMFNERRNDDWEEGYFQDEFDFTMGLSPPGESYNEVGLGIPLFQGNADFQFRFPKERIYTTDPRRFAEKYDTLISVRAPVGSQNMAREKCCIGRGVAAFIYKDNHQFYTYTYFKLKSLIKEIRSFNDEGTVFGSINRSDFEKFEITIPPLELVNIFQDQVKLIDDKIILNCDQIVNLEKLRDMLLPKLMNGDVGVEYDRLR